MVAKKVTQAEQKRRKAQAEKDKKRATKQVPRSVAPAKSTRKSIKAKANTSGSAYAKLVLDPCHAVFTQSNMPGGGGSQMVRCPFRQIVYAQSAGSTLSGTAASGTPACDSFFAVLTPHAMVAGTGPDTLGVFPAIGETSLPISNGGLAVDLQGLSGLSSYAGEMRPVSACVRITCMAPDTSNSGLFFGYEGTARQILQHITTTDNTTPFIPCVTPQNLIFNGSTSGQTFKTFEARINYPAADPEWQEMRNMTPGVSQSTGVDNGVTRSPDGSDPDFSQMPIAIVGVTSAQSGARYLIDGAVVYEWAPKLTIGLSAPPKKPVNTTALASSGKIVQTVARKMGGMLVSTVADMATGGSASTVLGLLREAYSSM